MKPIFCVLAACALLISGAQAMTLRELRTLEITQDGGDLYARYYLVGSV